MKRWSQVKETRIVTRRFVLQAGFLCNARCRFCYYRESLEKGTVSDFTTEEVKKKLREGRRLGKDQVDISGGEPTIRKDIFEIIRYAKETGYRKICLITNGIKMHDESFCNKLIEAGMNDILFSIHSPIEEEHDYLTQVKGSWRKLMAGLDHISKSNIEYRINTTVTNANYKNIDSLFKLLRPYKPHAINLLIFNPSEETVEKENDEVRIVDYNKVAEEVSKAISKYGKDFETINVRWLPFCLLIGHEELIRTRWQKMYEDQEWDPYLNIKYNRGLIACILSFFAGCLLYPFRAPMYGKRDFYTFLNECITTFRVELYHKKLKECKKCSLRKICDGLPRDYVKRYNKTKLTPYKLGEVIRDPLYFCRDYDGNFESLRRDEKSRK